MHPMILSLHATHTHTHTHIHTHTHTGSSSSASSSDDEIKEAFDNRQSPTRRQVLLHHTHRHAYHHQYREKHGTTDLYRASEHAAYMACHRPVRVVPVGYRKRSPKYFAQMSAGIAERPSLDFNKMHHSKRLVMVCLCVVTPHWNLVISIIELLLQCRVFPPLTWPIFLHV